MKTIYINENIFKSGQTEESDKYFKNKQTTSHVRMAVLGDTDNTTVFIKH